MSHKEFEPSRALLPAVLARLTRETGRAGCLKPLWEEVVGPVTARHTTPLAFEGDALLVEVPSPKWSAALKEQEAEVLSRLAERLGEASPRRLVFRAVEPK